jgi:hypothetical protein
MRVLIACEFSQIGCLAFRNKGHEAYSCDIIDCTGDHPEWHIKCDVLEILDDGWDIMIAHDPCTYQCNSGVRWLHEDKNRWILLDKSCAFTKKLLKAPIKKICRENPIPHKYAIEKIGRKYDQLIQPWQFGHGETKATCLWLKGLPKLKPTNIVNGREARIHKMAPSKDRGRLRSITYQGIANAMAEQYGTGFYKR